MEGADLKNKGKMVGMRILGTVHRREKRTG